jgi:hypothetical protein
MPIQVTCPGCDYHFLVGDEFAGQPGRCPECGTVIQVPDPHAEPPPPEPHPEPHPFQTPHFEEPHEEITWRSRRRDNDRDRYENDQREDYDDRLRERSFDLRERTFDRGARAAKWQSVSNGLRNLMVAVIILAVDEIVRSAFDLVDGVQPGQGNNLDARTKALLIFHALVSCIAMVLWAAGRIGCARAPYVPARRIARPAGVIAGITAVCGVLGMAGLVGGILVMQQNMGAGSGLLCLGVCTIFPAMLGFIVAELMGLISQIRMATGLHDRAFGSASKALVVVIILLTLFCLVAVFGLFVFMVAETNKAQQQQQQQQNGDKNKDQPPAGNVPVKGKGVGKNGPGPGNPQNGQQPPPPVDLADYPNLVYGMIIGRLLMTLIYSATAVICFQLGRTAIRREIAHLVGDPHDHPHDRY